ncbi:MAG: transposase [Halobacteriota archaeon]
MLIKTFKYKLEPNRKQKVLLNSTLDVCRELYNMGLEQRKMQRVGQFEQMRQVTALKSEFPEYKTVHAHVLQNVIKKLNRSFENFFRRCKEGGKVGFPRFKGRDRYDSFQFNNTGFNLSGRHLQLSKIGNVKVRLSRELPKGAVIKTCTVKRSVSGWFATLIVETTSQPLPVSELEVGIDVGISHFAALSDGTFVPNPRFYENGQAELRRAQRKVSRRHKSSNRRRKAVILLRKVHERIANKRLDFLHKHSTTIVQKFGLIAIEDLNVAGMSKGNLAKQILDASWSTWRRLLFYKAEWAGRTKVAVPPQYTSQECDECEFIHKDNRKSQAEFECIACGHKDNADTNSSKRILARARKQLGRICPSNVNIPVVVGV